MQLQIKHPLQFPNISMQLLKASVKGDYSCKLGGMIVKHVEFFHKFFSSDASISWKYPRAVWSKMFCKQLSSAVQITLKCIRSGRLKTFLIAKVILYVKTFLKSSSECPDWEFLFRLCPEWISLKAGYHENR